MGTPLVSVIVPVYKTPEQFLRACIESIQQQTIKDLGVKEAVKKISEIEDEELLNAIETSYQKLTSKQLA